jgi:hypothetical protein
MLLVAAAIAATFVACVLWLGRRSRALRRTALVGFLVAAAVWGLGIGLMSTGWKDVDGWIDCHDYCHGWHRLGGFLFWTPLFAGVMLLLLLGGAAVIAARSRAPST